MTWKYWLEKGKVPYCFHFICSISLNNEGQHHFVVLRNRKFPCQRQSLDHQVNHSNVKLISRALFCFDFKARSFLSARHYITCFIFKEIHDESSRFGQQRFPFPLSAFRCSEKREKPGKSSNRSTKNSGKLRTIQETPNYALLRDIWDKNHTLGKKIKA